MPWTNWSMQDEMDFLRNLGSHAPNYNHNHGTNHTRLDLIMNYKQHLGYRHDWGELSRGRLMRAVNRMIESEIRVEAMK
jgi:hypothetical protein